MQLTTRIVLGRALGSAAWLGIWPVLATLASGKSITKTTSEFFQRRHEDWPWRKDAPGYIFRCTEDFLLASLMPDMDGKVSLDCGIADGSSAIKMYAPRKATFGLDVNYEKFASGDVWEAVEQPVGGSAYALPFKARSIDIIVLERVLLHLELEKALPEFRRVLKVGGVLVATTITDFRPTFDALHRWLLGHRVYQEEPHARARQHLNFYGHERYAEEFGGHGLTLRKHRYGLRGNMARFHNTLKVWQVGLPYLNVHPYGGMFAMSRAPLEVLLQEDWASDTTPGMILGMSFTKV